MITNTKIYYIYLNIFIFFKKENENTRKLKKTPMDDG